MKVCLIVPPSPFLIDARVEPPLGILYIAASAEKAGHEVQVIDLAEQNRNYMEYLEDCKSDVYGIYCTTPQYPYARKIAGFLRQKTTRSLMVIGGPHPTHLPDEVLKESNFDVAVIGEGDETFVELLNEKRNNFSQISGIVFKDGNSICRTNRRGRIGNIDELPFPAHHLVDLKDYTRFIDGKRATTVITSRGCPFKCAYCDRQMWGGKVIFRSPSNVLDEIKKIKTKYGIDRILFVDDTFTLQKTRLKQICEGLSRLDIKWRCWTRVDQVDHTTLKMMNECGCVEISFGIESGSQRLLDLMNKGITIEQSRKAILNAKKVGMIVKAFLMVGIPGESYETFKETRKFIEQGEPDDWILSTFIPIPGSDIWNNPSKYGVIIKSKDYKKYYEVGRKSYGGIVMETKELNSPKLAELRDEMLSFLREKIKVK